MKTIEDNVVGVRNESRSSMVISILELVDKFDVSRNHHPSSVGIKKTADVTKVLW